MTFESQKQQHTKLLDRIILALAVPDVRDLGFGVWGSMSDLRFYSELEQWKETSMRRVGPQAAIRKSP